MNDFTKVLMFVGLLAASPVGAQQKKPAAGKDNVQIGSVATDGLCDTLFVPTGPMKMLLDVLIGTASSTMNNVAQDANNPKGKPAPVSDAKSLLKAKARTETWLPVELEVFLGDYLVSSGSVMADDEAADDTKAQRVQQIFDRVTKALPSDQPYRFKLRFSSAPSANMKAIPGGTVVIDSGLLEADELLLAALFAHEIEHVTKRHYTRQIQGYIADTMSIFEVTQTLTRGRKPGGTIIETWMNSAQFLDVLFSAFHTDQELEADACVPRLLKAANYSPDGGVRAFRQWALKEHADAAQSAGTAEAKPQAPAFLTNARRKSEEVLSRARQTQTVAKSAGPRSLQRTGGIADSEVFSRNHPPGPDRGQILEASLKHWSTRDPGLRPAGTAEEAAAAEGAPAAAAQKEQPSPSGTSIFSTIRDTARRLRDSIVPAATAAEPAAAASEEKAEEPAP